MPKLKADSKLVKSLFQEEDDRIAVLRHVVNLKAESKAYRDTFVAQWLEIQEQIETKAPASWADKEDWQTKVYVPLQAKTSETAVSFLSKMLFGVRQFFQIVGFEEEDREKEGSLTALFTALLEKGKFWLHNDYVTQESVDLGTSFMKILVNKERTGLTYSWRSIKDCFPDPRALVDFYRESRYWAEEFNEDISDIMANDLYTDDAKDMLLAHLGAKSTKAKQQDLISIPNTEGNTEVKISQEFRAVTMTEFWGDTPVKKTKEVDGVQVPYEEMEKRLITMADDVMIMRNDLNEYGVIPVVICRVKRRKYHLYGKGFMYNGTGLQDLINSLLNLGFDSLKISSMDIIALDESAVADPSSIEYRPLAVWKMREGQAREGVQIQRTGTSSLGEVLKGVTLIDQIHQDATGVTRHAQGTPTVGKSSETLGEYQLKIQAIEQRFLKIAREMEEDYLIPVIKLMYIIVTNERLFPQSAADRILGVKTLSSEIEDPDGKVEETDRKVPKIDLSKLSDMNLDFLVVGLTQYIQRTEMVEKLKEILSGALQAPQLAVQVKVDKLFERILQMAEIPDYKDFMREDKEKKEMLRQLLASQQGQPPPGAAPAPSAPVPGAAPPGP